MAGAELVGGFLLSSTDLQEAHVKSNGQHALHAKIVAQLGEYPISGLYDDEGGGEQEEQAGADESRITRFAAFLRTVRDTLACSPRNELLDDLQCQLEAKIASKTTEGLALAELYTELGLALSVSALQLEDAVAAVVPGKQHDRYIVLQAAAAKAAVPGVAEKIRAGMAAKAAAQGVAPPSEAEVQLRLESVQLAEERRRAALRNEAESLHRQLNADAQYQRFHRVQRLWAESGGMALLAHFHGLDHAQGEDRRIHGGQFEERHARLASAMVVQRWLHQRPQGSRDWKASNFGFYLNAAWRDIRQKPMGEIDAVVTCHKEGDEVVIAILEMKAGWFDLPAALLVQHAGKLADGQRFGHPSIWVNNRRLNLNSCAEHEWADPRAQVAIFAATLIPEHRYVIGIEQHLLRPLCQALYAPLPSSLAGSRSLQHKRAQADRGNGIATERVDPDNRVACARMLSSLRVDPALQPRLVMSPQSLFKEHSTQILVLEDFSVKVSNGSGTGGAEAAVPSISGVPV